MSVPRPCIEHRCPQYAEFGKSRCERHQAQALQTSSRSAGTTAAWKRARDEALRLAGYRCSKCGRTDTQARAAGTWLEVHHPDGRGVRALQHDIDELVVLCRTPCHLDTLRKQTRPTWQQRKAEIEGRVRERSDSPT